MKLSTISWMGLVTLIFASIVRPAHGFTARIPAVLGRTTAACLATSTCLYNGNNGNNSNNKQGTAGSFNPFTSLVGDMASSLLGNGKTIDAKPAVNQALAQSSSSSSSSSSTSATPATSWQDVRSLLESMMQTDEERQFRQNLSHGYGPASPLHTLRLFDPSNHNTPQDVRVTFYRDSASWCPYCQKVWLALEEKRIPYRVEKINMRCYGDKPGSFLRLQPSGNIPVAVIDGRTYGQSNDILQVLEQTFADDPRHPSLSPPPGQEQRAQALLRLERELFSAWMYWLTGNNPERFRDMFVSVLQKVERELASSTGPFFLGAHVSLVDFMFAPFLERMAASLLFYKGFQIRFASTRHDDDDNNNNNDTTKQWPAINAWFDAMETLESYQLTKSDYYTHCWDLPPQLGGCTSEPAGAPFERAINGEDGSWELPLQPHNGGVEPDWEWAVPDGDPHAPCREAVERISANHEAIVRFAARGAGRKGMPPFSAPLADPNATPSDAVMESVDAFLRTTCLALLEGTDKHEDRAKEIARIVVKDGGPEFAQGVVDSLAYLRDRVGVPRDMKLPAARQLRAHLNWSIGKILDAEEN